MERLHGLIYKYLVFPHFAKLHNFRSAKRGGSIFISLLFNDLIMSNHLSKSIIK